MSNRSRDRRGPRPAGRLPNGEPDAGVEVLDSDDLAADDGAGADEALKAPPIDPATAAVVLDHAGPDGADSRIVATVPIAADPAPSPAGPPTLNDVVAALPSVPRPPARTRFHEVRLTNRAAATQAHLHAALAAAGLKLRRQSDVYEWLLGQIADAAGEAEPTTVSEDGSEG